MSFEKEFADEYDNLFKAVNETVRVTFFTAANYAINKSPVGNISLWKTKYPPKGYAGGQFRSNWFPSTGSPSSKTTDSIVDSGSKLAEIKTAIDGSYSDSYYLTNNLPYAVPIESGHSSQAPNGVAGPATSFATSKIPAIERAANKKFGVS